MRSVHSRRLVEELRISIVLACTVDLFPDGKVTVTEVGLDGDEGLNADSSVVIFAAVHTVWGHGIQHLVDEFILCAKETRACYITYSPQIILQSQTQKKIIFLNY